MPVKVIKYAVKNKTGNNNLHNIIYSTALLRILQNDRTLTILYLVMLHAHDIILNKDIVDFRDQVLFFHRYEDIINNIMA